MTPLRPDLIALLDACKDAAEDDAPRHVLADWLEEYGDEHDRARAEFVRSQLARAKLDEGSPESEEHERREGELLATHGEAWLGPLTQIAKPTARYTLRRFQRGLLRVDVLMSTVVAIHQAQFAASEAWAWVESLRMETDRTGELPAISGAPLFGTLGELSVKRSSGLALSEAWIGGLLATPGLARLRSLSLVMNQPLPLAALVARATHLTGLVRLNLQPDLIADDGVLRLVSAPHLRGLRKLQFGYCNLTPEAATTLGESELFAGLETIDFLMTGPFTDAAITQLFRAGLPRAPRRLRLHVRGDEGAAVAAAVAAAPQLNGLRELDLYACRIGDRGAIALAESPHLRQLQALLLTENQIGPDGCSALAASPILAGVTELHLGHNPIGPGGMQALAASPHVACLRRLELFASAVGPDGGRALAASAHLGQLDYLNLYYNEVGDPGVVALARSPSITRLRTLILSSNGVGDEGVVALAASPGMRRLRSLMLGENAVGDAGARAIAESAHLAQLRELNLHVNAIGPEGGFALASSPYLQHATELDLAGNPVGEEAARALEARFTTDVVYCNGPYDL